MKDKFAEPGSALKNFMGDSAPTREVQTDLEPGYDPLREVDINPLTPGGGLELSQETGIDTKLFRDKADLKGPKREQQGEIEVSGVPPLDVQLATRQAKQVEAQTYQAQLEARMAGYGLMADVSGDLGDELGIVADETRQEVERYMDEADAQMGVAQELIDAARGNRINPGQFFSNVGDAGRFTSSIAIAAGYMAQASLGGVNLAGQVIDQAINRNVRAQEMNMLQANKEIDIQLSFVDKLRQLGIDRGNVGNLYQSMLIAQTQAQLDSIKAATASVETRAQIDQLWAGLDARHWEGISAYFENIKAKMRFKYSTLRDGIQQAKSAVASGQQAILSAGGFPQSGPGSTALPGTERVSGGLAGEGGGEVAPGRAAASGRTGRRAIDRGAGGEVAAAEAAPDQGPPKSDKQVIDDIRNEVEGMSRNEMLDHIERRMNETGLSGVRPQVFIPMKNLDVSKGEKAWLSLGEGVGGWARASASYITASKPEREKAVKKIQSRGQVVSWNHEIGTLLAEIGTMKFPTAGEGSAISGAFDAEVNAKFKKLRGMAENIANSIRTEGGSDAIRAISEWAIWMRLSGVGELGPNEDVGAYIEKGITALKTIFKEQGPEEIRHSMERWKAGADLVRDRFTEEMDRWFIRPGTAEQRPGIPGPTTGFIQ
jgi:hypothetical protein